MLGNLLSVFKTHVVKMLLIAGLVTGGSTAIGPQNLPEPLATVATKARSALPFGNGSGSLLPSFGEEGSSSYPPVLAEDTLRLLDSLPVKGKAPMTGYDRVGEFGPAWTDNNGVSLGHNGCKTRDDILARDMTGVVASGCVVKSGILQDPYTGKRIEFTRGTKSHPQSSMDVQIDHIVALGNAWVTGAQQLDHPTRVNLANDPVNLLAVDGPANNQKKDGDAATWLPPNKKFRCQYVSRQVQVKAKYHLWVAPAEKAAIQKILARC